jgi:hypothetical protein
MSKFHHHINISLLCANVVGLTTYCHLEGDRSTSLTFILPFLVSFLPLPNHPYVIRSHYCLIALLSLCTVFVNMPLLSILLANVSLGLSLNLGYHLTNQIQYFADDLTVRLYEGSINLSLALGVILSAMAQLFGLTVLASKLLVLITTLANFYLPILAPVFRPMESQSIKNKAAFALVPFYMQEWTYAVGYAIGIGLNTFELLVPQKYGKYFIISGLVLLEMLTYKSEIKLITELMRATMIYHFEQHTKQTEMVFVMFFLLLRLYFPENTLNAYLVIGYALLAILLWKSEYLEEPDNDLPLQPKDSSEIEMALLAPDKPISTASNKESQVHRDPSE